MFLKSLDIYGFKSFADKTHIDFAEGTDESEENYMRGYLGGILCAYRTVFGRNYEENENEASFA